MEGFCKAECEGFWGSGTGVKKERNNPDFYWMPRIIACWNVEDGAYSNNIQFIGTHK